MLRDQAMIRMIPLSRRDWRTVALVVLTATALGAVASSPRSSAEAPGQPMAATHLGSTGACGRASGSLNHPGGERVAVLVRIVTSSSAMVGWTETVASNCACMALRVKLPLVTVAAELEAVTSAASASNCRPSTLNRFTARCPAMRGEVKFPVTTPVKSAWPPSRSPRIEVRT